MAKQYKVTLAFTGLATISIEAETVEDARNKVTHLKVEDLARQGFAEVTDLKVGARSVHKQGAVLPGDDDDDRTDSRKPRPSGWYRPIE